MMGWRRKVNDFDFYEVLRRYNLPWFKSQSKKG